MMTDCGIIINSNNEDWKTPEFWKMICPSLSIGGKDVPVNSSSSNGEKVELTTSSKATADQRRQNLTMNGFALVDDSLPSSLINSLLEGIENLQGKGGAGGKTTTSSSSDKSTRRKKYPASFILLFDQVWELARISNEIMKQSTHPNNQFHYDILAWYIEKEGFSPHRDRQPDDAKTSFHDDDGQAKFVTHWIALSPATPENSCLYVIPKPQDPGYLEGDSEKEDPLQRALPNKTAFQTIRALPREAGTSLLFTHRIIHWGSARPAEGSKMPPRTAISFVCCDPTFEKPYLVNAKKYFPFLSPQDDDDDNSDNYNNNDSDNNNPPFHIRLLLVCAQLLIYYQRFDLPKETIKACYEYCKENEKELDPDYRKKVYLEFVNAMKEAAGSGGGGGGGGGEGKNEKDIDNKNNSKDVDNNSDENDDDDDDEEAVLEEMLNAEQGGYGEFEDDYDEEEAGGNEEDDDEQDDFEDDDDEEEGVSLFGKPTTKQEEEEPQTKRIKTK